MDNQIMSQIMTRIPKRLKKEPLVEVIWQVEFDPAMDRPIGDLLPGILYAALRQDHPHLQLHRLPTADMPTYVAQLDPNLHHLAKYRMEEAGTPFLFQVGDRSVTLNCRKPYVGWDIFKAKTIALINILENCGLIAVPIRHSLRYLDLLDLDPTPDLSSFLLDIKIGKLDTHAKPLQMRIEIPDNEHLHVIQFATPAQAMLSDGLQTGSIVDIETFSIHNPNSWQEVLDQLSELHECSKTLFFENILKQETIDRLEPEY